MGTLRYAKPPVALSLLAPASLCNQRCPACILTEVYQEPVQRFELEPGDYARFVEQFVEADVPIVSLGFHGYEVTLPRSWPYVEAVFAVANRHRVRKSFITNGMLLHKWIDRVAALDPDRIAVSLDGASPEVNDPLRGLDGAFAATVHNVRRLVAKLPELRERVAICSTLYHSENLESLREMPGLLNQIGISRWALSVALVQEAGTVRTMGAPESLRDALAELRAIAERHGIQCYANDDFGVLDDNPVARRSMLADFIYRLDPFGYVRAGSEIMGVWDADSARRWNPAADNAVDIVGYVPAADRYWTRVGIASTA